MIDYYRGLYNDNEECTGVEPLCESCVPAFEKKYNVSVEFWEHLGDDEPDCVMCGDAGRNEHIK